MALPPRSASPRSVGRLDSRATPFVNSDAEEDDDDDDDEDDENSSGREGTAKGSSQQGYVLRAIPVRPHLDHRSIDVTTASYSESIVRYFAAEFVGTFLLTLLSGLFTWGLFYHHLIEFYKANNSARQPTVELQCTETIPGNRTCEGYIFNPLAGGFLPSNMGMMCFLSGLAFTCASMLAPGATFNPSFTLMLCVGGLKKWRVLLPSVLAQLLAVIMADGVIFFLLLWRMLRFAKTFQLSDQQALMVGEVFFGVSFPSPAFSNYFVFAYAVIANIIFVFLMLPMALRCAELSTLAQEVAKGLVIAVFSVAFGINGLGALPNPASWLGGAIFLSWFQYPLQIWSRNHWYALKVPVFAPTIGIFLGSILAGCYLRVLYWKPPKAEPKEDETEEHVE